VAERRGVIAVLQSHRERSLKMHFRLADQPHRGNVFLTLGAVLLAVAIVLLLPTGIFFHPWAILGLGVIAGGSLVGVAAMREAVAEFLPPAPEIWYCRPGSLTVILGVMGFLDFVYAWVSPWPPGRSDPVALAGMICVIDAFILLGIAAPTACDWLRDLFSESARTAGRPSVRPPVSPTPSPFDFTPTRREKSVSRPDDRRMR
jgi:hypothetical protein